ncbi:preprotein translocase subunit YajC [Marinobacterium jannaschii]|uniref:preprotein translocase subunit YajC n=1 Tax=Marinobacterium jannaschii TaxID=64970 RepID=UPI0004810C0A
MSFFISTANAAEGAAGAAAAPEMFNLLFLVGFGLIFYFFMWRPQSKRAKEHKNLLGGLSKGDEVMTSGGLVGKITKVNDDYVVLEVSEGVEMQFQKVHVAAALPKGTIKSI